MHGKVMLPVAAVLLFSLLTVVALPKTADPTDVTVHEWGTFTSVAGQSGEPVAWRSYGGPTDLPRFVEKFGGFKGGLSGTVRMETPVLYFYGARDSSTSVKVLFPKGTITEWYPKATTGHANNTIEWPDIKISPNVAPDFPLDGGRSHYYAARETDAAPLEVGSQKEKFLFYRGVGSFSLPISAKAADGKIVVRKLGGATVDGLVLFENRGGNRRHQVVGSVRDEITLDASALQDNAAGLSEELVRMLMNHGLYQREARAMIETWRDSWFEEGTRLFYIVPKEVVDAVLPVDIRPAPTRIERVFVGRMEIITPAIEEDVRQAIAANDRGTLEKYGRFLEPIARRIGAKSALLDSLLP